MELAVYVPVEGTAAMADVPRGGAIVGDPSAVRNGRVLVTVAPALGGALGLRGYREALADAAADHAGRRDAGRMRLIDVGHLVPVATYDTERGSVVAVTGGAALALWSGEGLDAVAGARMPRGYPAYAEVAEAMRSGRRLELLDDTVALVTEAGQVVLPGGPRFYELLGEDDPRIPRDAPTPP